jgi:hypothetical protein
MDEARDDKLMQRKRGETYGGAAAGGAPFDEAELRNSARVSTWRSGPTAPHDANVKAPHPD